jgi:hypothetical protein
MLPHAKNPDEHRPERPVFLAVDKQFGERPRLGVPVVGPDPIDAVEVRKTEDVDEFGELPRSGPSRR